MGEESLEDGACDWRGLDVAGLAAELYAQGGAAFGRELGDEASEALAETEVGSEHGKRFGVDARGIDGVVDRSFEQRGADGVGDFDADAFLCFGSGGAEVRGKDDIGQRTERRIGRGWFDLENIEGGTG